MCRSRQMINLGIFSYIYTSIYLVFFLKKDHFFYSKSCIFVILGSVLYFLSKEIFRVFNWWKYHSIKSWVYSDSLFESRFRLIYSKFHKWYKAIPSFLASIVQKSSSCKVQRFSSKTGTWPEIQIFFYPAITKERGNNAWCNTSSIAQYCFDECFCARQPTRQKNPSDAWSIRLGYSICLVSGFVSPDKYVLPLILSIISPVLDPEKFF